MKKKKKDSKEEGKSKKPWFLKKKDKKESGFAKMNPKGMGSNTEGVKGFGAVISGKKKKKY